MKFRPLGACLWFVLTGAWCTIGAHEQGLSQSSG
jgi:hypothetical protein